MKKKIRVVELFAGVGGFRLGLERLNMFPDNHTKLDGISDVRRAFFMGNALVVGVIEKIGVSLAARIMDIQQVIVENQTHRRAA